MAFLGKESSGKRFGWKFQGIRVCQEGWKKLYGMGIWAKFKSWVPACGVRASGYKHEPSGSAGVQHEPSGSARFRRLSGAARAKQFAPPVDRRYLLSGCNRDPFSEKESIKSEIISFLEGMYQSVAETLPDVKDDTYEPGDAGVIQLKPGEGSDVLPDSYGPALQEGLKPPATKSKRPRSQKKSIKLLRTEGEIRWLPPGNMKDYFEQFNAARDPQLPPASFAYFWRAPLLHRAVLVLCLKVSDGFSESCIN